MSNPAVSVILPVHNAERYLRECIDSVLAQTLREIEVLCDDDASTDASPAILAEYARRDNRVKVLTNSVNLKADASRNRAIEVAHGDFIYFIDSDDLLTEPDMFASLVEQATRENLDLLMFQARHFIEESSPETVDTAIRSKNSQAEFTDVQCGKTMTGGEMLDLALKFENYTCFIWMRLFRRSLFSDPRLRFLEGGNNADSLFTPVATMLARRAAAVNRVYYARRIHSGSVMTSALEDPSALTRFFNASRAIIAEWKTDSIQAIVAASGSRSANDLARRNVQYMARVFTQMPADTAQQALDSLGNTPDDKMLAAHLMSVRSLSRKLSRQTYMQNRAAEKAKTESEKLATAKKSLAAAKKKLEMAEKKLKRMRTQRDKRPNSVRACVKFIFRRLLGRR